jgi:ribosome modulation factor
MQAIDNGSNTISNDAAVDWMRQVRQQKRKCDEENGVLRNILKRAKADGQNTKSMLNAIKASKLDPAEVAADLREQLRLMALIHMPMTQAELFDWDAAVTEKTQRADDMWDADDKGYRAGRHGAAIEECPYDPGTELHVTWLASWHKGQAAIARELGPDEKQASTARARPKRGRQSALPMSNDKPPRKPRTPRAKRNGADASPTLN